MTESHDRNGRPSGYWRHGLHRDKLSEPSDRLRRQAQAEGAARQSRLDKLLALVVVAVGLAVAALIAWVKSGAPRSLVAACLVGLLLTGCHTISSEALKALEDAAVSAEVDLRDWDKLSDPQKRTAHQKTGRALARAANDVDGATIATAFVGSGQ